MSERLDALPPKARRPWYGRLVQFRLRTLMLLTAASAGVVWFWTKPNFGEFPLLEGQLVARHGFVGDPSAEELLKHGYYALETATGEPLARGNYFQDTPQGEWTVFHASGKPAFSGKLQLGARVGLWREWSEAGELRGETTYALRPTPIVGNFRAVRHGAAKTYAAGGMLASQGDYAEDVRQGAWTEFNQQGEIIAAGRYQNGLREGEWRIRHAGEQMLTTVQYLGGLPTAEVDRLRAGWKAALASRSAVERAAALRQIAQSTAPAADLVVVALDDELPLLRAEAIRTLLERQWRQHEPEPREKIQALLTDQHPAVASLAAWAEFEAEATAPALHRALAAAGDSDALEEEAPLLGWQYLLRAYRENPTHRLAILRELVLRFLQAVDNDPLLAEEVATEGVQAYCPLANAFAEGVAAWPIDHSKPLTELYAAPEWQGDSRAKVYCLLLATNIIKRQHGNDSENVSKLLKQNQRLFQAAERDPNPRLRQVCESARFACQPQKGFGGVGF